MLLPARHIFECDLDLVLALKLCAALAKRHGATTTGTAALHLAHEINPDTNQQQNRGNTKDQINEYRPFGWRFCRDFDFVFNQVIDQLWVRGAKCFEFAAVDATAADVIAGVIALNVDLGNPSVLDVAQEFRVRQ